jgi:hypothetical protein
VLVSTSRIRQKYHAVTTLTELSTQAYNDLGLYNVHTKLCAEGWGVHARGAKRGRRAASGGEKIIVVSVSAHRPIGNPIHRQRATNDSIVAAVRNGTVPLTASATLTASCLLSVVSGVTACSTQSHMFRRKIPPLSTG